MDRGNELRDIGKKVLMKMETLSQATLVEVGAFVVLLLFIATILLMLVFCCIHACCCRKAKYQGSRVRPANGGTSLTTKSQVLTGDPFEAAGESSTSRLEKPTSVCSGHSSSKFISDRNKVTLCNSSFSVKQLLCAASFQQTGVFETH